tara:strand:+ start:1929 stop:2198 length:270 start_codon:yes stop_codon:yes gene_type:complete
LLQGANETASGRGKCWNAYSLEVFNWRIQESIKEGRLMGKPSNYKVMGPITLSEGEPNKGTECYMVPVKLYWMYAAVSGLGVLKILGAW